jgi:hypothetical protein
MDFAIAGFSESRKGFTMSLRRGPLRAASPLLRNLPSESFAFFSAFLDVHEYVFGAQSSRNRLI